MKRKCIFIFYTALICLIFSACSNSSISNDTSVTQITHGNIYLYGEQHGVEKILNKEFELWYDYYHNKGMRHLFVEYPYYTAEFLNMWMQSDNDDIFEEIYNDWHGTSGYNSYNKEFFKKIKDQCPETIFHGTDVGHQFAKTGKRFLDYLKDNKLENSEQYLLTIDTIEQGRYYYAHSDDEYRENKMVENFIREFDKLNSENIMGIYGAAHTGLDNTAFKADILCMATQLKEHYGDIISSEDLSLLIKDIEPHRVDTIQIDEKDYLASYYGEENIGKMLKEYSHRKFWRLENAYDDFKDNPKTGDVLPYNNYPMIIETGQVFVIDYIKKSDKSVVRTYYRSDGHIWNGYPSTEEFTIIE